MLFIRFIATILMIIQSVNIYAQTREITLTDKTPPAIWIGTKAPTVITFPGDIGVCDETSRIINVSYGEAVKTNEGNWFKEILVNLDLTSIETNKDAINAERAEFGITCHYYVKGKRKGIELTLKVDSNNKKRVPFVLLKPTRRDYWPFDTNLKIGF